MNGLTYAYLGDAYYELKIRKYLIDQGYADVDILHKKTVMFTSGKAQALIYQHLIDENLLDTEEIEIFKRGRNASPSRRHNISAKEYQTSTGFEALIGYLSLHNESRCQTLIMAAIDYINQRK